MVQKTLCKVTRSEFKATKTPFLVVIAGLKDLAIVFLEQVVWSQAVVTPYKAMITH